MYRKRFDRRSDAALVADFFANGGQVTVFETGMSAKRLAQKNKRAAKLARDKMDHAEF